MPRTFGTSGIICCFLTYEAYMPEYSPDQNEPQPTQPPFPANHPEIPQGNEPPPAPPQGSRPPLPASETASPAPSQISLRIAAGACAILLGSLGVHKFVLGYTTQGIIMLALTLLTCGLGSFVTGVVGLIEGIVYLTKSDEEFHQIYVKNKRAWF
jgi:TM2 domain-containing membrane protein YozV